MKNHQKRNRKGFTLVELLVVIAIIATLATLTTPAVFKAVKRADQAKVISNLKDVHKSMTMFAIDNDGLFPSEELVEDFEIEDSEYSNSYFAQLFASNTINNEENLFWTKTSQLCNKKAPDNITSTGGQFDPEKTLKAGDVGFAYVAEQSNSDSSSRPLIFDSPPTGEGLEFDPEQWDGKVVVLRVGGSVNPEKLNRENRLLDGEKNELLTTDSEVWGSRSEITIVYPEPK